MGLSEEDIAKVIAHQQIANKIHELIDGLNGLLLRSERAGLRVDILAEENQQQYRAIDGSMLPSTRMRAFVYTPIAYRMEVPERPTETKDAHLTEGTSL